MRVPITYSGNSVWRCQQSGVSIVEAMVAALLLAILFAGVNYALSRGLVSQRYATTQGLAMLEMREGLQQAGTGVADLCDGDAPGDLVWVGTVGTSANCSGAITVDVDLPGYEGTVDIRTISLTTQSNGNSQGLFGGNGIIEISNQ